MVGTVKCPVCGQQCIPSRRFLWLADGMVWYHEGEGCWWEDGITAENSRVKPAPISLWQRIKKHGWNARIF